MLIPVNIILRLRAAMGLLTKSCGIVMTRLAAYADVLTFASPNRYHHQRSHVGVFTRRAGSSNLPLDDIADALAAGDCCMLFDSCLAA